jgi:hypothetical protein
MNRAASGIAPKSSIDVLRLHHFPDPGLMGFARAQPILRSFAQRSAQVQKTLRWIERGEGARADQRLLPTNAKMAPCGSRQCAIQLPPGTCIGPWMIWPPASVTRAIAASTAPTLADSELVDFRIMLCRSQSALAPENLTTQQRRRGGGGVKGALSRMEWLLLAMLT